MGKGPTPPICEKDAPKICHKMRHRMVRKSRRPSVKQGDFHRNMAYKPQNIAYKPPRLRHVNHFMGDGDGLEYIEPCL